MTTHPEITRALAQARITELRASGPARRRPRRTPGHQPLRQRTGWWLVSVGLRLAAPTPTPTAR